jgi:metallopeptidase MepB
MSSGHHLPQPLPCIPSVDEIIPIIRRNAEEYLSLISTIEKTIEPSAACFNNVIAPIVRLEDIQSGGEAVIAALKYAAPDKAIQKAVEDAWAVAREVYGKVSSQTGLYILFKAVKDKGEPLDFESQKLVNRMLRRYTQCGHGRIEEADIQRWLETGNEIAALRTEFNRNIREYDRIMSFTDEELDGLPSHELHRHPLSPDGKRLVSLKSSHEVSTVMRHVHNSNT